MNNRIVAAAIPMVFGIAFTACNSDSMNDATMAVSPCPSEAAPTRPVSKEMSVEQLIELTTEATTCPGYVFHFSYAEPYIAGPYSADMVIEAWVDIENNQARMHGSSKFTSDEFFQLAPFAYEELPVISQTEIIRTDGRYTREELDEPALKEELPTCHGEGREALHLVVPCDAQRGDYGTTLEAEISYDGRSSIALLSEGEYGDSNEAYSLTTRLFFDADTYLPIAQTAIGTLRIDETYPVEADFRYAVEFVDLDTLPDNFFDPASIGYVEPDPYEVEASLDAADVPVYWIGREFEANKAGLAGLALADSSIHPTMPQGESIVFLTYRPIMDEFAAPLVRIELLTNTAWEYREDHTSHDPCDDTVEFDVPIGTATIRRHYDDGLAHIYMTPPPRPDDCTPANRFSAALALDDVVVLVDTPRRAAGGELIKSPYNTEAGIELLVRSLKLRE